MNRLFVLFTSMSLVCSAVAFGDINTIDVLKESGSQYVNTEGVDVPVPQDELKRWQLAYQAQTPDGMAVIEWIPQGEDINNWNELLQIQQFIFPKDRTVPADLFANQFVESLKGQFPELTSRIINKSSESVLLEWSLPTASKGESAQNELVRFIATKNGLFRIAYTKKVASLPSKAKEQWLKILADTKVVNNTTKQ